MNKIPLLMYFQYTEYTKKPEWTISNETDSVLIYSCQKAATTVGGRKWTVWFTPEIPIGEGPWLLRGLPGLILKAEDSEKHYVFECIGVEQAKDKPLITIDSEKKYGTVPKQKYLERKKAVYNDIGIVIGEAGGRLGADAAPLKKREYNPIERLE